LRPKQKTAQTGVRLVFVSQMQQERIMNKPRILEAGAPEKSGGALADALLAKEI
jgi:hypothetical protein